MDFGGDSRSREIEALSTPGWTQVVESKTLNALSEFHPGRTLELVEALMSPGLSRCRRLSGNVRKR